MLDPWIIEEIIRREEERRREQERVRIEAPLPDSRPARQWQDTPRTNNDDVDRGVVVIDI
jgi:hypothetical protein